jgi:hypothetical protein
MAYRKGSLCSHVGCSNRVNGFTSLCVLHDHRKKRTGSPTGRCLRKRDLEPYRDIVSTALDQHRDNAACIAALQMAARMLALNTDDDVGNTMRRLRWAGATPRELLTCVGAVWAHSYFRHESDGAPLTFQLAHQVTLLRPLPTRPARASRRPTPIRPGARVLQRLGNLLRSRFGVFFQQLLAAVETATDDERRLLAEMRKPIGGAETGTHN